MSSSSWSDSRRPSSRSKSAMSVSDLSFGLSGFPAKVCVGNKKRRRKDDVRKPLSAQTVAAVMVVLVIELNIDKW